MQTALYFAYGSNMLVERLQRRCPTAQVVGRAVAKGFGLSFAKTGQDGSGKATLFASAGTETYGVVYRISRSDLIILDQIEGRGRGYERLDEFQVGADDASGKSLQTITYISGPPYLDDNLLPFDWYMRLVVEGARQNGLPSTHIAALSASAHIVDLDQGRPQRLEALEVLAMSKRAASKF